MHFPLKDKTTMQYELFTPHDTLQGSEKCVNKCETNMI